MQTTLLVLQVLFSLILIVLVLVQAKGVGFGRSLGSQAYHSRRGMEILVFRLTIAVAVLFVVFSVATQFFVS